MSHSTEVTALSPTPSPGAARAPAPTATMVLSPIIPSSTPKWTASPTVTPALTLAPPTLQPALSKLSATSPPPIGPALSLRLLPTPVAGTGTPRAVSSPVPTTSPTRSPTVVPSLPLVDVPSCPPPSASPHLWLARPIPPEENDWVSTYYPYGSTAGGEYLIHHGVDIVNPEGTPVWAAGSGTVWYAGDDLQRVFGLQPDFYGRLVIVQMDLAYHGQPVFTLYGHLSSISVEEGQRVEVGQKLGEVGATGVALGPHLHFEVRITDPEGYNATRNPELWLRPHPGRGIIAGQVLDEAGRALPEVRLGLYPAHVPEHPSREGWTYANRGVNRDEEWYENLVLGDVPSGEWAVVAYLPDQRLRQRVTVRPGEISWVCLYPLGATE